MIKIKLSYIVKSNEVALKSILKGELSISTRLITKLKNNQNIFVNGVPVFINTTLYKGDIVEVDLEVNNETDYIAPESMTLDVLYEDDAILAVNKPSGIVVHPSCYHLNNTLANGVKAYLNNSKKVRPINRLDRDTSGIVLFAKNAYVQENIKIIEKEYIAVVQGNLEKKEGKINAPIARKEGSIMERCVDTNGQKAITNYSVVSESADFSVLKVNIETGRTHQIRVHMAYIGHPIVGDTLYGNSSYKINTQALHAFEISFVHPITHKSITIKSPEPGWLKEIFNM